MCRLLCNWFKTGPKDNPNNKEKDESNQGATVIKEVEDGISKTPEVMRTNDAGLELIKDFEGFRENSYKCPAGKWTIGFGSTKYPDGLPVIEGEHVNEEQATELLRADLDRREHLLNSFLLKHKVVVNENQFSALISFGYNVGMGWLINKGSVHEALKKKDLRAACKNLGKYNKARVKGLFGIRVMKELKGLTRRREAEQRLFWT